MQLARTDLALQPDQIPAHNDRRRKNHHHAAASARSLIATLLAHHSRAARREIRGFTVVDTIDDSPEALAAAALAELEPDRAHPARIHDVLLGGHSGLRPDHDLARAVLDVFPAAGCSAAQDRTFLQQAVRFCAEHGIDQFLDLGSGIPHPPHLHEIVHAVNPDATVVYVDHDPLVGAATTSLLADTDRVTYVHADLREPTTLLISDGVSALLDLSRPFCVTAFALLHWLNDKHAAHLIHTLMQVAPLGSCLVLSHATLDFDAEGQVRAALQHCAAAGLLSWPRTAVRVREMFLPGLDLLAPGMSTTARWPAARLTSDGDVGGEAGTMLAVVGVKGPTTSLDVIEPGLRLNPGPRRIERRFGGMIGAVNGDGALPETGSADMRGNSMTEHDDAAPGPNKPVDLMTDRAHSARIYDYLLGGKDNYLADREAAENALRVFPNGRTVARSNRDFMRRSAEYWASLGIDQFIDIGTGIPTQPNLHQIVQQINPAARIVYVDNDPIVLAHAAALIGTPEGIVEYVHADAREPDEIVHSEKLRRALDLTRPVAVSALALLHWLDDDVAQRLISTLMSAATPGSYLTLSHGTYDADTVGEVGRSTDAMSAAGLTNWFRAKDRVSEMFLADVELIDPGIVFTHRWRPDQEAFDKFSDADIAFYGLVARKP